MVQHGSMENQPYSLCSCFYWWLYWLGLAGEPGERWEQRNIGFWLGILRWSECVGVGCELCVQYKQYCIIMKMEKMELWGDQEVEFQQNEIVWAKITGHPWWPAMITALPNKRNTCFRVDFFADNTHAYLASSKIAKYQLLRSDIDLHKHMKKGLRKAIGSADEALADRLGLTLGINTAAHEVEATVLSQKQLSELPSIKSTQLQEKKQGEEKLQIIEEEQHPQQQKAEQQKEQADDEQPNILVQQYSYEQRERYVNNLLVKYQLDNLNGSNRNKNKKNITRLARFKSNKHRRHEFKQHNTKTKRISKLNQIGPSLFYLLSKRLDKFLKHKLLGKQQRKLINISLARQIQSCHNLRIETAIQEVKKLFKWLDISSSATIAAYYESWSSFQSEKEKPSNMTNEE